MIRKFLAIAALLAMAPISAKADLIIDNFNSGPQSIALQSGSSTDTASGLPTSDVLGGTRSITLTVNDNPGNLFARANVVPSVGAFSIGGEPFVSSTAVLGYFGDGPGLSPPVDLTGFGDQFTFDILSVDLTISLNLRIYTSGGDLTVSRGNLSAGVLNIGFSEFGGLDLSQVTGIELTLAAPDDADAVFNSFGVTASAVPEPSTLVLGLAGVGLLGSRRAARAIRKKLAA